MIALLLALVPFHHLPRRPVGNFSIIQNEVVRLTSMDYKIIIRIWLSNDPWPVAGPWPANPYRFALVGGWAAACLIIAPPRNLLLCVAARGFARNRAATKSEHNVDACWWMWSALGLWPPIAFYLVSAVFYLSEGTRDNWMVHNYRLQPIEMAIETDFFID